MFKLNLVASIAVFSIGIVTSNQVLAQNINESSQSQPFRNIQTIATGLLQPYGIALDDKNLVITVNGGLLKIDESGNVETIATLTPGSPAGVITLGSEYIVVNNPDASLMRITRGGSINTIATNLDDPVGVAVQDNDFVVGNFGLGNGSLLRIGVDGTVSNIATTGVGGPTEIFVKDNNFYITDFTFGRLLQVSATGEITEIATGLGQPLDIDFDGKNFIITDFANGFDDPGKGRILRVSQSGEVTTLVSGIGNPSGIVIEGSNLLFTDIVVGNVSRIEGLFSSQSIPEPASGLGLLGLGVFGIGTLARRKLQPSKTIQR